MTMTDYEPATDHYAESNHHHQPARRPRAAAGPSYVRSVFTDPRVRALVAGYLEQVVAELHGPDSGNADRFVAGQLDDVINELRGTV